MIRIKIIMKGFRHFVCWGCYC